ncbi:MAG: site-specific DNA-methyltransferase [Prevotella sp.]|nr:site-specific DNA-methyltransferase [Prevotella sp.]
MELDTIYNMDCLEGMKQIPDGTIDAVICDLPYGTTACSWDTIIPFDKLWEQYNRIVKEDGVIVLFGTEPFSTMLRTSNLSKWRYDWIWDKVQGNNFLSANKRPLCNYEIISVFYHKLGTYNPQPRKLADETIARNKRGHSLIEHEVKTYWQTLWYSPQTDKTIGLPKAIITFSKETNNQFVKNKTFHPTQKPVDLLRYLVLTYTNEGDTVLDNCMGSGTTAIACIKERRHFIGFELNKEYFDKACKRIKAEQAQLTLF